MYILELKFSKIESILGFRILSFVVISSQRGCVISQKKSSANKITNNFWRFLLSESKQKQNSKLVGAHQSFILHLKSKNGMSYGIYSIQSSNALFLCVNIYQKLIYDSKLWKIEESQSQNAKNLMAEFDGAIFRHDLRLNGQFEVNVY